MNREELIKRWLNHDLSSEEQKTFEGLEDYDKLISLDKSLKLFEAPNFDVDSEFLELKSKLNKPIVKTTNWIRPILRIAAIVVLSLSIFYYVNNLDTEVNTLVAQQTEVELPDASLVELNANSTLTFNKNKWSKNRQVKLEGEAFFKVAKGKKFDVLTSDGVVSVLGTQFNVKQRQSYFEVICYEGKVSVSHNKTSVILTPGKSFTLVDGKEFAYEIQTGSEPQWMSGESQFNSVPLKFVLKELENQYGLKVFTEEADSLRLFTGSFTHKNLNLALQSITIPLNLKYHKSGNTIILKRE